jgi:hypothetical protein
MSWLTITQAIQQRFRDNWTLTPITSVAFENEQFDVPVDGNGTVQEWLYIEILGGRGEIAGYGRPSATLIRRSGVIMFHAFTPLNSGGSRAIQLVESAASIFAVASFSGVQCWSPNPPSPPTGDTELGNRAVNGSWWRCYSSVSFQYDLAM